MPLDPQVARFLEQLREANAPPMESVSIDLTRRALILTSQVRMAPVALDRIETRTIPGPEDTELRLRFYWPLTPGPLPAALYFHGGGWVLNSIETHDDLCQRLAHASDTVVVSVDYRLAPETRYPGAVEDVYAALKWVADNAATLGIRPDRIAVGGDSAGGNLAAALCLVARDRGGPAIAAQYLIYPITDCDLDRPSYHENAEGYFLTRAQMAWFWDHYVPSVEQRREPYASPLRATSLAGLPPATVLTAEYDPLRDEGEAYAAALQQAGVPATVTRYDGMIHAFVKRVDQFDRALIAIRQIGTDLKRLLSDKYWKERSGTE